VDRRRLAGWRRAPRRPLLVEPKTVRTHDLGDRLGDLAVDAPEAAPQLAPRERGQALGASAAEEGIEAVALLVRTSADPLGAERMPRFVLARLLWEGRGAIRIEVERRVQLGAMYEAPSDHARHPVITCWLIGDLAEPAAHTGRVEEHERRVRQAEAASGDIFRNLPPSAVRRALLASDGTRTRDLRRDRPVRGPRRLTTMDAQSLYSCSFFGGSRRPIG
jgi:hypothetical protein